MPKARSANAATPLIVSLLLLVVAVVLMWRLGAAGAPTANSANQLVIYCAAGIRPAVEPVLVEYEAEYGVQATLQVGPSGGLESQIRLADRGDLFIPAAVDPFLSRMKYDGLIDEIIPIAQLRLVLAFSPGLPDVPLSLDELLTSELDFGLCNIQAAAGQRTKQTLTALDRWESTSTAATASLPTVTELAEAIRNGGRLKAGLIWSTTASQFGLEYVELPELEDSTATVGVGVLRSTKNPTAALRLARYLAAPDRGQQAFLDHHYQPLPGDPWAVTPRVVLYSGTVNRNAIKDSLREFEAREGCEITTVFDGCGSLVGMMKSGSNPDAYFACDVSYVDQVSDRFGAPLEVSDNQMVILVRKGNPLGINSLNDLAQEGIEIGLCDPDLTALGTLTRRLLLEVDVYKQVSAQANTVTTGDLLVAQMLAGDKLDAAIVYEANCIKALDELDLVRIDHPLAKAIQPFSVHREATYPQLTQRLRDYLTTQESRERFEHWGFNWRVVQSAQQAIE